MLSKTIVTLFKTISKISFYTLLVFLATVFVSKEALLSYNYDDNCESIELVENGEEKESEREEVKEEIDLFAQALAELAEAAEPQQAEIWVIEGLVNGRHSEVLTPPPDLS